MSQIFQKSSKNLKIFQKSENLPNIWKSSKNRKIFQNLSDQMSQRSQVSRVALCMSKVKVSESVSQWVSEWVTRSPIELLWTAKNYVLKHTHTKYHITDKVAPQRTKNLLVRGLDRLDWILLSKATLPRASCGAIESDKLHPQTRIMKPCSVFY